MIECDENGCIFSWSTIKVKEFKRKREKAFIFQEFLLKVLILRISERSALMA